MDAIVQFIRNGSSCLKDLHLFQDTFLYDPSKTAFFFELPPPFNETTPLEALNSLCHFYAFIFTTLAGLHLVFESGWGKLHRIHRLMRMRTDKKNSAGDAIVQQSLREEESKARRSIVVGFCALSFGIAFLYYFANCWHLVAAGWLGGIPALMLVTDAFEVAFLPYLWYALVDARELLKKSDHMKAFSLFLKQGKVEKGFEVTSETFSWMLPDGWTPFWSSSVRLLEPAIDDISDQKRLNSEVLFVEKTLNELFPDANKTNTRNATIIEAAERLESDAPVVRMRGYLEYVHFLLNFVAFYGFMMGCLAYHFDNEEVQPAYVRNLKLGLPNQNAEWRGYFFGELMWTIQPVITLTTPMLLRRVQQTSTKVKTA